MSAKPKRPTYAELRRKLTELEAQMVHSLACAHADLPRAHTSKLMGSGVLITVHANGGREICKPFMIKDGLSSETIAALQADLQRSHDLTLMFKPQEKDKLKP